MDRAGAFATPHSPFPSLWAKKTEVHTVITDYSRHVDVSRAKPQRTSIVRRTFYRSWIESLEL